MAITADDEAFLRNIPDVTVFVDSDAVMGIPTIIFVPVVIFSLALGVMSSWLMGALFALVLLSSLYALHKGDKDALMILFANIGANPDCWISGLEPPLRVVVVDI
jgi:type IV secretory pathway VirB3-like protein|tara:strand:+ start:1159 stop:1473 length:315 start_codon:yes stop_codon:yes gene_type:complete